VETSVAPSDSKTVSPIPARVLTIRPGQSKIVCGLSDSREIALSGLVGSNVRIGDNILVSAAADSAAANEEIFIHKSTQSKADVYRARVGYAALPKQDKRGELFVRVEIVDAQLGINAVHISARNSARSPTTRSVTLSLPRNFLDSWLRSGGCSTSTSWPDISRA